MVRKLKERANNISQSAWSFLHSLQQKLPIQLVNSYWLENSCWEMEDNWHHAGRCWLFLGILPFPRNSWDTGTSREEGSPAAFSSCIVSQRQWCSPWILNVHLSFHAHDLHLQRHPLPGCPHPRGPTVWNQVDLSKRLKISQTAVDMGFDFVHSTDWCDQLDFCWSPPPPLPILTLEDKQE